MKKIKIAFLINLTFSVIEFLGGIITGSISIITDALHDFLDALSIGISYVFERISLKKPDKKYTFGYSRYSTLGAFITMVLLICGSIIMIITACGRILNPIVVDSNGMIILAVLGVIFNTGAAIITNKGKTLNQRAVNLHMIEDCLGWAIVLIGAIAMKFTNLYIIDPILSFVVALYILLHALKGFKETFDVFLEKVPSDINVLEIEREIQLINGVNKVSHLHIWSIDGTKNCASICISISKKSTANIKKEIRKIFLKKGIEHVTIEVTKKLDECNF